MSEEKHHLSAVQAQPARTFAHRPDAALAFEPVLVVPRRCSCPGAAAMLLVCQSAAANARQWRRAFLAALALLAITLFWALSARSSAAAHSLTVLIPEASEILVYPSQDGAPAAGPSPSTGPAGGSVKPTPKPLSVPRFDEKPEHFSGAQLCLARQSLKPCEVA